MMMHVQVFVCQILDLEVDPTEQQMESEEKIRICFHMLVSWTFK